MALYDDYLISELVKFNAEKALKRAEKEMDEQVWTVFLCNYVLRKLQNCLLGFQ